MAELAELAAAVAVRPTGEAGSFTARLDPQWSIGDKLNGGYLLAVLAEAATAVTGPDHPHPEAVSAHFVAAPEPGPAEVTVRLLRQGRAAAQVHAVLSSGGRRCVEALLTCGRLAPAGRPDWSRGAGAGGAGGGRLRAGAAAPAGAGAAVRHDLGAARPGQRWASPPAGRPGAAS